MSETYIRPEVVCSMLKSLGLAGWDTPYDSDAIYRNRAIKFAGRWLELMRMEHWEWEEKWSDDLEKECHEVAAILHTIDRYFPLTSDVPPYGANYDGSRWADEEYP